MSAVVAASLLAFSADRAADAPRFVRVEPGERTRIDWVASGAGVSAYGWGRQVRVEGGLTFEAPAPVVDAAFVGRRLFVALANGALEELRFADSKAPWSAVSLVPVPTGALHLAAMDTWLVVAEDGIGVRFVPVTGARACHQPVAESTGWLPWKARFVAVATAGRVVYAATAGGGILVVDARDPIQPRVARSIPHDGAILAMAASPFRLYVLGPDGLELIELDSRGAAPSELHREVTGTSIQLVGRLLRVASGDEGLVSYRDESRASQLFEVSANDDFFSPQDLSIALGDTVRFTNVTGNQHNVVSCTPAQIGCDGATATESFTSGSPTGFWTLDHTFIQQGLNPYLCRPHAGFMFGSVTVSGTAGAPPGVSDGSAGAPMLAGKLDQDGSTLSIAWDTTACSGASDYQILYGYGFGLPGSTGNGYELAGARCSIGVASPFTWTAVPPAFSGSTGFVYWLVVATDASATEGSWGKDSAGVERGVPANGGASGECGIAVKDLTNACPP